MIGILGLQGNIAMHQQHLARHNVKSRAVKKPEQLEGLSGLILPGGESTTISKLIRFSGLEQPVKALIDAGLPTWGTCCGVVLLGKGGIWQSAEVDVERNAYGSQLQSVIKEGRAAWSDAEVRMAFIRAPRIASVAEEVKILARLDGDIVAARQQNILLTTFHPELTGDAELLDYFLDMQ